MSYLFDFPPGPLPHNIRSPPYVVFAIRGKDIVDKLPPQVPLNLVLHFAPKLKQWVLPPPSITSLPWPAARLVLRKPYVGLDILSNDIDELGLRWILCKMQQASRLANPRSLFLTDPTIIVSVSIYKTWLALDLPVAAIQNLHTHIHSRLMLGAAVTLAEMKAIWEVFPHTSYIPRAMGLNFIRSHIDYQYGYREFLEIKDWYMQSEERFRFFKDLKNHCPAFVEVDQKVLEAPAQKLATSNAKKIAGKLAEERAERAERTRKLLEKTGTRKVSSEELKEREVKDGAAMRSRLRRVRSDESIRSVETVIWDPPTETKKDETTKKKKPMGERANRKWGEYLIFGRKSGKEALEAEKRLQNLKQRKSGTLTEAIKHKGDGESTDDERKEEEKWNREPTFQPTKGKKPTDFSRRYDL